MKKKTTYLQLNAISRLQQYMSKKEEKHPQIKLNKYKNIVLKFY